jgi:predicted transport protein
MPAMTPGDMLNAIEKNLPARTGKTLDQWVEILKGSGVEGFKPQVDWLRKSHGLGGSTAYLVAERLRGRGALYEDPEKLVSDQYQGKETLRPIYDELIKAVNKLGKDITIRPCMGYVPIMRRVQFAVIKATTKDRVDLGLRLGDQEPGGILLPAKNLGGGDKIKLRIELRSKKDITPEVKQWLKAAYEMNG